MLLAVSEITRDVDTAFWLIGGACALLLAGITVTMVVFVVKYRRSRRPTASQTEGHMLLEITWTIIPTVIVTWMFFVGYQGFGIMRKVPADAMVVQVTGRQWSWAFHYPDAKLDTAEMVVPVNRPIKVELTSDDVVHSFYIPDFRVKEDAVPGKQTYLWFEADREGTYHIFCAEFCGTGHAQMLSTLRVVSQERFERWLVDQEAERYQPLVFQAVVDPDDKRFGPEGLNIDSQQLFRTFCASCHGVQGDGSGLPGQARDFRTAEGWRRTPKVTDIYRTLADGIEGTQMRAFPNLTPWQRVAVAHYVRHFLQAPPPQDTRDDYDALVREYELDKIKPPGRPMPVEQAMELMTQKAVESRDAP